MPTVPQAPIRSRGWCFTLNNPGESDNEQMERCAEEARYVIRGIETGEEGTNHWQGYVLFKDAKTMTSVKKFLPRAHLEKQRGNNKQAIDYCKKDGDFKEWGSAPQNANQKEKWGAIIKLAEEGKMEEIKEEYPRIYLQYYEKLKSLAEPSSLILETLNHEWWYGATGTGKSQKLWKDHPKHYQKQLNKWWDGYQRQEVVAIEEWSPKNECTASQLKIWADRYPFPGQIKNGTLHGIRPAKVIVTSNYTIEECFPRLEDYEPLKRRFKQIRFTSIFGVPRVPAIHPPAMLIVCEDNAANLDEETKE
ncbi:replication-associated protein [Antarctic virus 5_I_KPSTAsw018Ch]|nr:replication-associated protein [Antarctic virus 5_I_KPSTAsw002Ad]QNG41151.1 replication-associated protein [Antarctic virus 5_I_KPSTAsw004Ad]QNG41153.1 replication-associated protein [Antarctic virus 5_I_KPSTAsw008Ad]QNG41155.1 replication-associated protein [Antarctic virus 5_I_KPSTAsw009Ad]QNG41157.1 replication-associated protein [Antarctic virus 5_I_KPSTAsw018Ch]QNG41159.1 replication-associated protein [Antarctic virus 5_I_KPSTAsw020Ch]